MLKAILFAYATIKRRLTYVRDDKPQKQVAIFNEIPSAEKTVPSRGKCRPLTWLYRG
jgi:hypothetical protein